MHLDDWFEPDQLVKHAANDGIFEVMMNVSDLKPCELKLRFDGASRVMTIEGRHNEHQVEHIESQDSQDCRRTVTRSDSLRAHFKRSFTLSMAVLEQELECKLSPDGHHLILTAPVIKTLADMVPYGRLCYERARCAKLDKCVCTSDKQERS